jgi:hypothetical protein
MLADHGRRALTRRVLALVAGVACAALAPGCAGDDATAGDLAQARARLDDAPGAWPIGAEVQASDAVAAAQRVLGARADLRLLAARSSLAAEHVRYQQVAPDGSDVLDGQVAVHLAGAAPAYRLFGLRDRPAALHLENARVQPESVVRAAALAAARGLAATGTLDVAAVTPAALPLAKGAAELRAGWRVTVATTRPTHLWEVWVDGATGVASVRRDLVVRASGTGLVYLPNPVATTGDVTLTDDDDQTSPELDAARVQVPLLHLDGSGDLRGDFVDVQPGVGTRVHQPGLDFVFDRSQPGFEEVNAYHAIDAEQSFLQGLGFTAAKAILATPFLVRVDAVPEDNSYYISDSPRIDTGQGGVDDAEDADVIHHEYGHAVHDDIIPGYGVGADALALGEGFGDLLAASVPTEAPLLVDRACIAPWDATSYSHDAPPCLRRVDGQRHYPELLDPEREVHLDGEIWSGAMWELYRATGLGPEKGLALVIEAFFAVAPDVSFLEYSDALLAADTMLHQGQHLDAIQQVLWRHGLLRTLAPPGVLALPHRNTTMRLERSHLGDGVDEEVTIQQEGAEHIQLHFSGIDLQSGSGVGCLDGQCDSLYLYDGEGRLYAILGGRRIDFDAPVIPGDTVVVRWVTDRSVSSAGFTIDRYTWDGAVSDGGGCGCRVGGGGSKGASAAFLLVLGAFGTLAAAARRARRQRPRQP